MAVPGNHLVRSAKKGNEPRRKCELGSARSRAPRATTGSAGDRVSTVQTGVCRAMFLLVFWLVVDVEALVSPAAARRRLLLHKTFSEPPSDSSFDEEAVPEVSDSSSRVVSDLKKDVLIACAVADRGFGASPTDRTRIEELLGRLAALNPTPDVRADLGPLRKCWRLVYTSAADVTTLAANPLLTLSGIYQDARACPTIVNVIDVKPRPLAALPAPLGDRVLARQRVFTSATRLDSLRVALDFTKVQLDAPLLPPLALDLPKLPGSVQAQLFDLYATVNDALLGLGGGLGGLAVRPHLARHRRLVLVLLPRVLRVRRQ